MKYIWVLTYQKREKEEEGGESSVEKLNSFLGEMGSCFPRYRGDWGWCMEAFGVQHM